MFRLVQVLFFSIVAALAALAGVLAFGTRDISPEMATSPAITAPFRAIDLSTLPAMLSLPAQRGGPIAYRRYGGGTEQAVILLHGAAADGASLHVLASGLAEAGMSVIVPDIRGHGRTGRRGDIEFDSQLGDDIQSLVLMLRDELPKAEVTLAGFSTGGGLALTFAGGAEGDAIDRLVLIAPTLDMNAPTMTSATMRERWAVTFTPRILALDFLNRLGLPLFNRLEALAFPLPAAPATHYSYRLMKAMLPADYAESLKRIVRPIILVAGGEDELFAPEALRAAFVDVRKDVSMTLVPGVSHAGLVLAPPALFAITDAILARNIENRPAPMDEDMGFPLGEAPPRGTAEPAEARPEAAPAEAKPAQ